MSAEATVMLKEELYAKKHRPWEQMSHIMIKLGVF